ncbi:MAG: efflux RND transporter permease subunit [Bacteroidia bacterium]
MWASIARFILRNRLAIILVLGGITAFFGFYGLKAELSYEAPKLLPDHDTTALEYKNFKKRFGQDGAVMVIGIPDSSLYTLKIFNAWYDLGEAVKTVGGVKAVLSVARLQNIRRDDSLEKFVNYPLLSRRPQSQAELDSVRSEIMQLPFYKGIVYNDTAHSTLMAITFDNKQLNTKNRLSIVDSIRLKVDKFVAETGIKVHYSGMPFIRTAVARKVQNEMTLFMVLAFIVTAIILMLFFRSFLPVIFSLAVVFVGVIWSVGLLVLCGYHISVLTGLIPPLLIVIGVPNCIMLLNKYHIEFNKHGNKIKALARSIEKVGISLFMANITTSIGFAVFCSTDSQVLFEFGLISSISVILTYAISMMLVPIVFSFLPAPSVKHTGHLQSRRITGILEHVDNIVHRHRPKVYITVIIIVLISAYGMTKILPLGFVVDDLPAKDPIVVDLRYFEKNYNGVLPFEISIDTKKPNGVFADGGRTLYKINKLQKLLAQDSVFSKAVSVVEGIKFFNQAYNDGNKKEYRLPGAMDLQKLADFAKTDAESKSSQFAAFIDSTKRYTRISIQMKDIGSIKLAKLVERIKPRIDSVFNYDYENDKWLAANKNYKIVVTGNSLIFLRGNQFLVENLLESVLLAIILIAIVLYTLFMSPRMIFISVIPSLIPLMITAGIMGFFHIYIKPSTILVFSIAFGIASDGTLYFLTKYRQEMKISHSSISKAVSVTIKETGVSMIYTAIILFCGFGIFTASSFGGTAALGILISVTLLIAYCSNLVLLPCFLLTLEKRITNKAFLEDPLIEVYDEDEDIDLDELEIKK